jgi:DNA repair protein RadD
VQRRCLPYGAGLSVPEVESAEGDLVEFGSRRTGTSAPSIADKISFHAELLWIARERGHKPGWVGHKYKERFGVWPNDPAFDQPSPVLLA